MTEPAAAGALPPFSGAVLAGGSSRRMGRDKALLELGGRPLVARVADALTAAGAAPVRAVGGDLEGIAALGIGVTADRWPGEGPLGGVLTALDDVRPAADAPAEGDDIVVVLACDLAMIGATEVVALVAALAADASADIAAPDWGGHPQLLTAAWRRRVAPAVGEVFGAGERSVRRAVRAAGLAVATVAGLDAERLGDLDTPDDLRAARRAL